MAEKSASPFSGLDKALIRSTKPAPLPDPVKEDVPLEQEEPAKSAARVRTVMTERSNVRTNVLRSATPSIFIVISSYLFLTFRPTFSVRRGRSQRSATSCRRRSTPSCLSTGKGEVTNECPDVRTNVY
jgi:hypothetical protein